MQRRTFLKSTFAAALGAAAGTGIAARTRRAAAAGELRLLTWEGYADDAWVKPFEAANDATVSRTYVGTNDEYMAKLAAGGGDYDLVVIVSSLAQRAINAGFVEPVDDALVPNLGSLYPRLQRPEFSMKDGQLYGVATFLAITPVTVNAEVIPEGNNFGILFDPKYAGRIAMWDDVSMIADVAAWMGYENIWTLDDGQLAAVKAKLIEQKPLLRTYWSQAGEAIDLFLNREIVASNSWSYVTAALKAEGFPAREFFPGRPVGAIDSHFIVKGTGQRDLAHKFLNHIISAEVQGQIAEVTGYSPTNPASKAHMSPETWERLGLEQGQGMLERMHFWEDIPRRGKYLELLNEVKAAG